MNQSIVKRGLPTHGTHWSNNLQWWENIVEEIEYSGMDYIALLTRGNQPNAPDRGNGNPRHIPRLVEAMHKRGATSFKLALFDDPPNSWVGSKNWNESEGAHYGTSPSFNLSDTLNWKYIWDYNLKQAIEHIPVDMRYEIDGRLVIFFWNVTDRWVTHLHGNLSKLLRYIKDQCEETFGFEPFVIVQHTWFHRDQTLETANVVDAVHGWFSAAGGTSWSLHGWRGMATGVVVPGFGTADDPRHLDPFMGTTDSGMRLKRGLENTVNAGARTTLVEGFTNAAETASIWRSNDQGTYTFYEYPNQRLNIIRSFTKNPYPDTLKVEAEACDFNFDLTPINTGGAYLHMGDLDVLKCDDIGGGWYVTDTEPTEWMEWRELPLLEETRFELRYKSTAASSVKISIDGDALPVASLPSTDGEWSTIDIGTKSLPEKGVHTVRLTIVSGSPDINYFNRIRAGTVSSEVALQPLQERDVHIYPNPASDFIRVLSDKEIGEIKLYSISGQLHMRRSFEAEKEIEFNVSNLTPGLYFLRINNKSHKLMIR